MDGLDFLLSLNERFAAPASKAESALASLERQIQKEQQALAALEAQEVSAAAKLRDLVAGSPNPAAIAAFEKQGEAVKGLEAKLSEARDALAIMSQARVTPADMAKAERQVEALTSRLEDAKAKLAELGAKTGPSANVDAVRKAQEQVRAIHQEMQSRRQSIGVMQNAVPAWKQFAASSKDSAAKLKDVAGAAQAAGGPLGSLISRGQGLVSSLGSAGAAGAVAVLAAVLVAVVAASFVAAAALTSYALSAADAARSSRLLSDAAGGSAAAGAELEAVVSQLGRSVPVARDKLAEMARALELGRLRGADMQHALTAMGLAASAVGDSAASKLEQIATSSQNARRFLLGAYNVLTGEFESLSGTGIKSADVIGALAASMRVSLPEAKRMLALGRVSIKDGMRALEQAAQSRLGPIVARQMLSLDVQGKKLKESFAALFSGVNVEKFLKGLGTITDFFSQSSVGGYALRQIFSEAFTFIFDKASAVFPYVRAFMYGMLIAGLTLYLHIKKLGRAISEAFGSETQSSIDWVNVAFYSGIVALGILTATFVALGAVAASVLFAIALPLAGIALGAALAAAPFVIMGLAIYGVYRAAEALYESLTKLDLSDIAARMLQGFTNAIRAGAGAVASAARDLASSVMGAFSGKLEIHSPSRVFERYGQHTAEGYARGVERGEGGAADAIEGLGAGRPRAGGGKLASAGPVQLVINVFGGSDDELITKIREAVLDLFEQEASGGATA